jgi:MFS family permease
LTEQADPISRYRYLVLIASLLMLVMGTGSVYLLVVSLKPIATEFNWVRTIPSVAYSLQYIGAGIGGILMGIWLDRGGMFRPALLGAVMIGIGGVLTARLSGALELFFICGVMMGLFGRATLFSPLMANISRWFEDRKGMAVGIVGSGQAFAGALWPPVFQYGIDQSDWRTTAFWYGCVALVVMVPLSLVFLRDPPELQPSQPMPALGKRVSGQGLVEPGMQRLFLVILCVAIVGCCVSMSLPLAHLVSHISDLGYEAAIGARMLALALIAAAFSSMVGVGALSARFGGIGGLICFSATQCLALGLLAIFDDVSTLYVVAFIFGLGYGGVLPSYPVIVREYLPAGVAGSRVGIVVLFGGTGMAIGAWVGGFAFDQTAHYQTAFLVGFIANLANLAIITWVLMHYGRYRRS